MGHERIERRLHEQDGVVAVWQLTSDGISRAAIRHATERLRPVFDGVYASGHAPLSERQRLLAASFTAPGTWIDRWSAAHAYGLWKANDGPICVMRRGSGGPRSHQRSSPSTQATAELVLSERRSTRLAEVDRGLWQGVQMLSPARTVLDLVGLMRSATARDRLVRTALRLRLVDARSLDAVISAHRGRRGVAVLRALADEYAPLPADRTRSDAEMQALQVLALAGLPEPRVNVRVCGLEADLVWPAQRLIIELDSNEYHPSPGHDERKSDRWTGAGWRVERLGTHVPSDAPWLLVDAARRALLPHR